MRSAEIIDLTLETDEGKSAPPPRRPAREPSVSTDDGLPEVSDLLSELEKGDYTSRAKTAAASATSNRRELPRTGVVGTAEQKRYKTTTGKLTADLAKVNKMRTDKKISTQEMIVDLPLSLNGKSVDTLIRKTLKTLQVDVTTYSSPLPNVIRWRRKVTAEFNKGQGYWEPIPLEIRGESHVLCLLSAKDLVGMLSVNSAEVNGQDLEAHVLRLKRGYDKSTPIYLIEGLHDWIEKNKNMQGSAFPATGMSQTEGPENWPIDEDTVEDALAQLQIKHNCLIHHTTVPVETAQWVVNFTQQISTIPDRQQKMQLDTSFCMDSGQIRKGDGIHNTYIQMLQQNVRATAPISSAIATEYPTVTDLVGGFRTKGPAMLTDLRKGANKDGSASEGRIGPALSKRIFNLFMATDPELDDI